MAPRSKSTYSARSAAKLSIIMILYNNNTHTKSALFFGLNPRIEAQEQIQRRISIVKMAILRFCGPHGMHTQGVPNLISQDPRMGIV